MTRARDELVLMQPQRYYVRGHASGSDKHVYAPRSRFIADADLDAFVLHTPPAQAQALEDGQPGGGPRVDLKALMRGMWR